MHKVTNQWKHQNKINREDDIGDGNKHSNSDYRKNPQYNKDEYFGFPNAPNNGQGTTIEMHIAPQIFHVFDNFANDGNEKSKDREHVNE